MSSATQIDRYVNSGLINKTNLEAWHVVVSGETANNQIFDYSGKARHASCAVSGQPTVTGNVIGTLPGMYFNGSNNALEVSSSFNARHVFALASFDDATFDGTNGNGLLSDPTTYTLFYGAAGTTKWFEFVETTYTYYKSNVSFASSNMQAPMSGNFALVELQLDASLPFGGVTIGQHKNLTSRRWKGYFIESQIYSSILTNQQRAAVLQYYNLKYGTAATGLSITFPDPTITNILYRRFLDIPEDYREVTAEHEYQDAGRSSNEFAPSPPKRWELGFRVSSSQRAIFDDFNKLARRANPFTFTDKFGITHQNVYIEAYDRNHEGHQSWKHDIRFNLVKYPS